MSIWIEKRRRRKVKSGTRPKKEMTSFSLRATFHLPKSKKKRRKV